VNCPKCGGDVWAGPQYLTFYTGAPSDWPRTDNRATPLPDALAFTCARCGFRRFQATVDAGGPLPAPAPTSAKAKPIRDPGEDITRMLD